MRLAEALLNDPNCNFWSEVHRCSGSQRASAVPVIDGVFGNENISKLWRDSFRKLYNSSNGSSSTSLLEMLEAVILPEDIKQISLSSATVEEAIRCVEGCCESLYKSWIQGVCMSDRCIKSFRHG